MSPPRTAPAKPSMADAIVPPSITSLDEEAFVEEHDGQVLRHEITSERTVSYRTAAVTPA